MQIAFERHLHLPEIRKIHGCVKNKGTRAPKHSPNTPVREYLYALSTVLDSKLRLDNCPAAGLIRVVKLT